MRYAIVYTSAGPDAEKAVAAYLPSNYSVVGRTLTGVMIAGQDSAGWTLDDYVIPRLASGIYTAVELVVR